VSTLSFAEHLNGQLTRSGLELVTAAGELPGDIALLLLGEGAREAATTAGGSVGQVLVNEAVSTSDYDAVVGAVENARSETGANRVIISNSRLGQAVAPRVAVRSEAGFLEDASTLSEADGKLSITRLSFLSRITDTVETSADN